MLQMEDGTLGLQHRVFAAVGFVERHPGEGIE
jgi:hypothetical protein